MAGVIFRIQVACTKWNPEDSEILSDLQRSGTRKMGNDTRESQEQGALTYSLCGY